MKKFIFAIVFLFSLTAFATVDTPDIDIGGDQIELAQSADMIAMQVSNLEVAFVTLPRIYFTKLMFGKSAIQLTSTDNRPTEDCQRYRQHETNIYKQNSKRLTDFKNPYTEESILKTKFSSDSSGQS